MVKTLRNLMIFLFLSGLLTACSGASAGPRSWIDQPLDQAQFGLMPVSITVHASDGDGVDYFEISLNDELVQTLSAEGQRLGEAGWQWQPAETGRFILQAVAVDTKGNRGAPAEVVIHITGPSSPDLEQILQASIDSIACLDGQNIAAEISITSPLGIEAFSLFNTVLQAEYSESFQPPLPLEISQVIQVAEPIPDPVEREHRWGLRVSLPGQDDSFTYLVEPDGRCPGHYLETELSETPWAQFDLVTAEQNLICRQGPDSRFEAIAYLTPGQTASPVGKLADASWIQVMVPDRSQPCWIAANLLEIPPEQLDSLPAVTPPPLPTLAPTDPPAVDSAAPTISGLSSSPDLILTQSSGCPSYSRTTIVQASISDDTAVASATASWSVGGESGQVNLTHSGGSTYQGQIGPVSTTGVLTITITAGDSAGNSSSASAPSVTVQNCIE